MLRSYITILLETETVSSMPELIGEQPEWTTKGKLFACISKKGQLFRGVVAGFGDGRVFRGTVCLRI